MALSDALSRGRSDSVRAGTVRSGSGAARDHQDPQHRQIDDRPEEQASRVLRRCASGRTSASGRERAARAQRRGEVGGIRQADVSAPG